MQDVVIAGVVFHNVPQVDIPKDGGGTAAFIDTSDADAAAGDIASGKTAYVQGQKITGTGQGGGGGVVEEKDVNFWDYDGTIVYSYTAAEFAQLSELPPNPSHTGLTAQGWNWSLVRAKAYVRDYGFLDIGQNYVTDNGDTRVYITLFDGALSPTVALGVNGTVTVDFGDGSTPETLTGTSLSSIKSCEHTYAAPGDYVISIHVASGSFNIQGGTSSGTNGSTLLCHTATTDNLNPVYHAAVKRVELGTNVSLGIGAFSYLQCLESCTIPQTIPQYGNYAFYQTYSLKCVTFPKIVTSYGSYTLASSGIIVALLSESNANTTSYMFSMASRLQRIALSDASTSVGDSLARNCHVLRRLNTPEGTKTIGGYAFYSASTLPSLTLPASITSIGGSNIFSNAYGLGFVRFKRATPPSAATSTFSSFPTTCAILFPFASLASYMAPPARYPSVTNYKYVGYATYESGATLPAQDTTAAYNLTWYATIDDAKAQTNPITTGNGKEVYCRAVAAA